MRKQNVYEILFVVQAGEASKENIRKNVNVLVFEFLRETEILNIYYLQTNMAVCSDIFLFILCLLIVGGLVFVLIYFIITLSDLECDYLNAQECCAKLNFVSKKIIFCELRHSR